MPTVEIITIGTELLLGDIQDTNSRFIAQKLKEYGYDLFRISTVGDNQDRISQLLREALQRSDILITTGGLGPTVDDPTREAVAQAFNLNLVFHEDLWEQITERFQIRGLAVSENNRKQAYIPENSFAIKNKYGTAPGFILPIKQKYVICLQGVPQEMEKLLLEEVIPFLLKTIPPAHFLFSKTLHAIGIGESVLDSMVGKYEKLSNPTVGLLAHAGMVDIRIVGSGTTREAAALLVKNLEKEIKEIASDYIFGADDETIESIISQKAANFPHPLKVSLSGFPPDFVISIPNVDFSPTFSEERPFSIDQDTVARFHCQIDKNIDQFMIDIIDQSQSKITRKYLGPPQSFLNWARNIVLYYTWLNLNRLEQDKK